VQLRRRVLAVVAGAAATTLMIAGGAPSMASPKTGATRSSVTSGQARFEVLSPTLIRTEFAGDSKFVDAATFNAIGRDAFAKTSFSAKEVDGWLTIDTDALTLKYKVGSGAFTGENLTVGLRAGEQTVTASPWQSSAVPSCSFGVLCEGEDLSLNGLSLASNHSGYTGDGFAAGFERTGNSFSFDVIAPAAGSYQFAARYANGFAYGEHTTRTLTVSADGGAGTTMTLPVTDNWDTWANASATLDLSAGAHTVTLARTATDSGNVNVDSVAVVVPGSPYPGPAAPPVMECQFGSVCEAESGALGGSASKQKDHNGYSGKGFVAGLAQGASDTIHVVGVPSAGPYALQLRYSNAQPTPGTASIQVGPGAAQSVALPVTTGWDSWRTVAVPVVLASGTNEVNIGCPDAGSCLVNLDTVAVTTVDSALLAPHAALGGYRRGLDGVNGGALSTPGLLYEDGWTLIDDTPSAIFNEATQEVTPRPDHGGNAYQDGYVFGYGHDYKQGLADLADLTGPSKLLPRWTYGVWYSEYYDRTAADFEAMVARFRSDGVPLDGLVIDTDFKSPDSWNGWEIDTNRFPDPAGFFDWVESQGMHNALNIHPSISDSDPQYAQAQATAKNALTKTDRGYTFDWADPNQLKAYFDLHQTMEQQGADIWWLDWCCDQSQSSLVGVTPDAFINQQYANVTNNAVGRGFAFSRAYGSLQAGGYGNPTSVPTGPWADKRTTLHFTGDTTSTWETLAAEVGYTPAESASTGLSAISHDIGGHTGGAQTAGSEPGSTKLADDLYARWVQFGTFQPIDRLHSDHSDRLPWQYGAAAQASAEKFLNLRENLVPYTYGLAQEASTTGVPVVRPTYLEYPDEQEAYASAGSEYFYGSDVLVAPATTPGTSATTSVWFPPGQWTDYFTGKTYAGGTTQDVTTDLNSMPVFLKAGAILPMRTDNVTNDAQNPLTKVTLNVAEGAPGTYQLYEDDGETTDAHQSATTKIKYTTSGRNHTLKVSPVKGTYAGQVAQREWKVAFSNATSPTTVSIDGKKVSADNWTWSSSTRIVTVTVSSRSVNTQLVVSYR